MGVEELMSNVENACDRRRFSSRGKTAKFLKHSVLRRSAMEALENRVLLSCSPIVHSKSHPVTPIGSTVFTAPITRFDSGTSPSVLSSPYTPAQVRSAYGVGSISFGGTAGTGAGQTIAIVDAYNDPDIIADTNTFSTDYGLPVFNGGGPSLTVLNQSGSTPLPANAPSIGNWDVEESLDVQWAHAIAPQASIILFEANDSSASNLFKTVTAAADHAGVSVVSMSFGAGEFSGEQNFDTDFKTPAGHQGVTFIASTGDAGEPGLYPALSPNVVAVGGTSLTINDDGSYGGETGWSGSGGGVSTLEPQPSFQASKVNGISSTNRSIPDVAMLADPSTGVDVVDTYSLTGLAGRWGGTSLAAPLWSGLIAIADQGRVLAGLGTLDGPTQTLPMLYGLPSNDFHDVTSGNNGFAAGAGYDLVTGMGSPNANLIVPSLAGYASGQLAFVQSPPVNVTAGATISPVKVAVETLSATVETGDTQSVTLSILSGPADATLVDTYSAQAVNGVATFSNLSLDVAGNYKLQASAGSVSSAQSSSFNVIPAASAQVAFAPLPQNVIAGTVVNGISIMVEDQFGNIVTWDNSNVTVSLQTGGGAFAGAITTPAVNGIATLNDISITTAGTYILSASDGSLAGTTDDDIIIKPAAATHFAISGPTSETSGSAGSFTVTALDAYGNVATGYTGTVHITSTDSAAVLPANAALSNGVWTFSATLDTAGSQTITATDSVSKSIVASATVAVSSTGPVIATAAKATLGTVTETTAALSVLGSDSEGESKLTYTWATTGTPPAAVKFSANGTNAAKNSTVTFSAAGTYSFLVTIKDTSKLIKTSSVTVTVAQTFKTITLSPASVSLSTSTTQQFTATAKDQFGKAMKTQPAFKWSVVSGGVGTISSGGLYSAGATAGTATIHATSGSVTGSASVTVSLATVKASLASSFSSVVLITDSSN